MSDSDAAPADPAIAAATNQAVRFKEATDKLRERSETTAKALAALGTTGLTAVGVAKFSDIYPQPPGETLSTILMVAGFLAMFVALAGFTIRLWDLNRPIVTRVNPDDMTDDETEREAIRAIYDPVAGLNGVESLAAYQARAFRFQRIADRSDDAAAAKLRARAERIRAEIQATEARAGLAVVRQRVNDAIKGGGSVALAVTFVLGLLAFGIFSDRLDSKRSAEVATLKSCSDAIEAKVDPARLPGICRHVRAAPTAPTPDQTRAGQAKALSSAYGSCVDTATEQNQPVAMCDGIKARLVAAMK